MSTAATTPRQGLMSPTDTDQFDPADFATSFGKLDAVPGTTIVANYTAVAALNWGIPQHGSTVLQADNGALWYWYNPSGTGTWKRLNSVGLLRKVTQGADVSTSITTGNGVLVINTGNVTAPGTRPIMITCVLGLDNSGSHYSSVHITLTDNGTTLREYAFQVGSHLTPYGNASTFSWVQTSIVPGSTHNYSVYLRSVPGSTSIGAGGTSSARVAEMSIIEL